MGASPHTPGQGAPRSHLRRNNIISRRDKIKIPKKGDNNRWGREMMGFLSPTFANAPMDLEGKKPAPSTPTYSGEAHGSFTLAPGAALPLSQVLLLSRGAWRSPAGLPRSSTTTTPSCCCWTESSPTSPSFLARSRHGRHHRAACVLNAEVPSVRR